MILWLQYSLENTRSMASLSMAIFSLRSYCSCNYVSTNRNITATTSTAGLDLRLSLSSNPKRRRVLQHAGQPLSAVGSGLEASITDPKDNAITLKNAEVVLESREENKIQLRVELPGDETQKVFDKVLIDLGRSAPPIPGFRKVKGGKSECEGRQSYHYPKARRTQEVVHTWECFWI
uniref:Trigger factor ribosome-binding bacterial domain-containing protein n=1 Tax=Manihot esculenta TaxID=3983 RepID=A0A2C9V217_MANES